MNKSSKYSTIKDHRINDYIDGDLEIIKNEILKKISGIECIILGGGFGRGEGSVIVNKSKIQPINDYDIYVITNYKVDAVKIKLIRLKLISLIKIRQIDIEFKTKNDLRFSKKSVANYDLKYASKLIYGNPETLNTIPDFKSNKILLSESLIPLNLYIISIIQSYPQNDTAENDFWGKQQISKSVLGWSMAILISEGKYHPSYIIRQKLFKDLANNNEMVDLVDFATDFKIKPVLNSKIDWNELWFKNLNIHLSTLDKIYSKYYNKKINNIFDIIDCIKMNHRNILKKIYGFITNNKVYKNRENLTIIELLILSYINQRNKGFSSYLIEIEKELKKRLSINEINIRKILDYCIDNDTNCAVWKKRGNKIFY